GAGGLGSGDFPAVILDLDGGGGRLGDGALDLDVTDQREVGRGGDVDRGVVGVGHGPFHVGLAGGDPHFAHEDVGEGDGVVALDDEIGAFGVGGSGVEFDHPFAVGVGGGLRGLAGEGDGDVFAGVGRAPDGDG